MEVSQAYLTVEHLSGEGKYENPQAQAWNLSKAVLEDIKNAAQNVLFWTPDGTTPQLSFADICQSTDETYIKFIDRLKDTIDKQVDFPRAKEERLNKLAVSNANENCKKIIRALPPDPEPTIHQMVETCSRLTTTEHIVAMAAGKGVAEAFVAQNKQNMQCCKCNELGHLKVECDKDFVQRNPSTGCPSAACLDCKEHFKHCPQFQYH